MKQSTGYLTLTSSTSGWVYVVQPRTIDSLFIGMPGPDRYQQERDPYEALSRELG